MRKRMKRCYYHHKMEPIDNFQKNDFNKDCLQNNCRVGQNKMVGDYNKINSEPVSKKNAVYAKRRNGKITEDQKNIQIRKINKQYGIKSRV